MNDRAIPLSALTQPPAARAATDHRFATHDGVSLFYRRWPALTRVPRGAIVLLHRGHEHSGRMAHLPQELDLPEFEFFAWDARGHGQSPGARGDAPSFGTLVRDVDTFAAHIASDYGFAFESIAIVAQSVGAVVATAWVHDYAPGIRALVVASPAFRVKLYVPLALPGLTLMQNLRGNFFVKSYVKPKMLTRDPERIASYESDPLIARAISVRILLGLQKASDRIVSDAKAITVPTQLLMSDTDWVVHPRPQHRFFETLGSRIKEKHVLSGYLHDTLGERDRSEAIANVRRFLLDRYEQAFERADLRESDRRGYTKDEADALARPLPAMSPRGIYWRMTRAALRFGGTISEGVRLGHQTGFDSGSTLDYVYRNRAAGRTLLGRFVDRTYLDSVGWRGIRERKQFVETLIADAMRRLQLRGAPIRIVDIAAGHGRYVLEALAQSANRPESILLRDYRDLNVRQASALIAAMKLDRVARAENADAFDRASLAAIDPRPTIGIASGLYELFSDNAQVGESLAGLADALPAGGMLVYTGQPWHPQLELIARALTSHRDGKPWVMRRRTQAELDQLVEGAGFTKLRQLINEDGIFTVSLAERKAA